MSKKTPTRPSRRPPEPTSRSGDPALRALARISDTLDAETEKLQRQGRAHAEAQRKATTEYLKGLARAGATIARLPPGAGVVSGENRRTRRAVPPSRSQGSPLTAIPGLADLLPARILPFATLRPPYDWGWTWTKYVEDPGAGAGTLEAYAQKANGTCGFEIASKHNASQENRARARAAVGVRFQPTEAGVLGIRAKVHVDEEWYLKWNYGVAHAWGWAGMLIQAFDSSGNLQGTPIDKKYAGFNESGGGSIIPPAEFTVVLDDANGWNTSLFVTPSRWYAIWIWCGGGIRAAGWYINILGMNIGSDAESKIDVKVDSIALYFTPLTALPNVS